MNVHTYMYQISIVAICLQSLLDKWSGPYFEQNLISFPQRCFSSNVVELNPNVLKKKTSQISKSLFTALRAEVLL